MDQMELYDLEPDYFSCYKYEYNSYTLCAQMAPVMQFSSVSQPGLQSLSSGSQYSQVVYSPPT